MICNYGRLDRSMRILNLCLSLRSYPSFGCDMPQIYRFSEQIDRSVMWVDTPVSDRGNAVLSSPSIMMLRYPQISIIRLIQGVFDIGFVEEFGSNERTKLRHYYLVNIDLSNCFKYIMRNIKIYFDKSLDSFLDRGKQSLDSDFGVGGRAILNPTSRVTAQNLTATFPQT
jgi:hypothetical protein